MADSRWALVTGASAGFGEAITEKLAEQGFNVLVNARRADRLKELKKRIEAKHRVQIEPLVFDVRDFAEVSRALQGKMELVRQVEILVNNAGLAKGTEPVATANPEDWDTMIDTNVKGLLYVTRLVLPQMITKNSGHIVNIGSVAGRFTYPGGAVYSSTKFAVRAISESLRMDLMGKKIRVTNIEPGMAETEFSEVRLQDKQKAKDVYRGMTPLTAQDIADTVWWCVERPAHVNIQELVIMPTDQAGVGPSYTFRHT
jgi:3-hydroxy acid dehydrogenase/malonic semialdehyde reductase